MIDEHEDWLRRSGNASKLGIPMESQETFALFDPKVDRDAFLFAILLNNPVMRIRGHGHWVTFEFGSDSFDKPLKAIRHFGLENFGPRTGVSIVNFAQPCRLDCYWEEFEVGKSQGGFERFKLDLKRLKKVGATEV